MDLTRVRGCTVLLGSVLLASCADSSAPLPYEPAATTVSVAPDLSALARYQNGPVRAAWAKTSIGPAGGSVRLLDFEIVVPPGAVAKTTQFEIRLPLDPSGAERVMAEFRPQNVKFGAPVTLRLPLRGTSADGSTDTNVLWWSGLEWQASSTTLTSDGRIETQTDEFSTFGTEEAGRGITPVGG